MINLKSFEDFVVKYAQESLKIQNRLNEGVEFEKNIYGNIINITNKKCLVINDFILALELEDKNNEVYCLYYDNSEPEYTKDLPKNYQFVDLSQSIENIRKQISKIFDKTWKLNKDLMFDYIINISPKTQPGLQYKTIANVSSFIFCYPFLKINGKKSTKDERNDRVIIYRRGCSVYYSFDESNVMDEFDRLIYDCRGISVKRGRKISSDEWNKFDKKDKSIRYLVAVFSEDEEDDAINNRNTESVNLDEEDYTWDPEVGRDDDHPFVGMSEPKIYAFSSEEVNGILKNHSEGDCIKVGDTNRTVSKRLSEWREKFPDLVRLKSWDAVIDGVGEGVDGKIFRDYTIHKLLKTDVNDEYHKEGKKITHVELDEFPKDFIDSKRCSKEFFRNCTIDDVQHAIDILKERCRDNRSQFLYNLKDNSDKGDDAILPTHDHHGGFVDRNIQKDTIDKFVKRLKEGKKKMLMYAVMRFGKTYVSCRCAQKMPNNRFTVIVTAKPGVRNEWTGTVNPNNEFTGYDMYDATDRKGGLSEMLNKWAEGKEGAEPTLESYFSYPENSNKHIMLFSSLHDLFGDTKTMKIKKEVKDKHKCFEGFPVDLLIIDECHYGTQTGNFGAVINERENPQLKEFTKTLNLTNTVKLYLSGTPYELLLDDKFNDDEVISTIGFMDIIDAKNEWDREHREAIEAGDEKWEDNPYFGTPEMLEFGYNLEDFKLSEYSEDFTTTFSQLFLCNKVDEEGNKVGNDKPGRWEFVHKQDVIDIFEILDGTKDKEGLVSFLDVPEIKKGNMCKHIVITLPNTNCCDALEDLLIEKRNEFENFGEYKIIKASTANGDIDTEKVKKLIDTHIKAGNKTITLTCDRLLTGVTIKPWDTMFFMKDCASAQEYDQAKFRIMTPYVKNVKSIDIDESGNPMKGESTKVNMKPQVLFVDFLQNRIVEMKLRRYEAEATAEGSDDYSERELRSKINREKGSITLLLLKNGKFVSGSSADVGKIVMDIREKRATAMSFDEVLNESDGLSDPSKEEIEYMLEHEIKRTTTDKSSTKTTVELRSKLEGSKPPHKDTGDSDSDEEDEETRTRISLAEKMRKKKEEDPEGYKKLVKVIKEARKTIIKDILMYILLKNRGNKSKIAGTDEIDENSEEDTTLSTIDKFGDLRDSFHHYTGFERKNVADTPVDKIPDQMKENDKIICSIFCEDLDIKEPDYDDPHKVSDTVNEIWETILAWWNIIRRNPHDKNIVLRSFSNMQVKYKKFEKAGVDRFESLRGVLSKYSRLGETEVVTPPEVCPKLFENVVIFSRKDNPLILDCYGGKIGEIFNEIQKNEKFKKLTKDQRLNNYYLICRTRSIAELNFFVIKNYLSGTHEKKRKWFNEHILIYDPNKDIKSEVSEVLTEKFETFSEFMNLLNTGKYISEKKKKSDSKQYEEEGGLWKLKQVIENKWKGMKFDVVVGNPPYGMDKKGSSRFLHYMIMKTALDFCEDINGKLCFIMPSKPILKQMDDPWYSIFTNAVCTKIDVQDKSIFKSTKMEDPAIFYCERGVSPDKHCKKLDVNERFNNDLMTETEKKYAKYFDTGDTMFKNTLRYRPKSDAPKGFDVYFETVKAWMTKKYFININNASGTFKGDKYNPGSWVSPVCDRIGVATYDDELNFLLENDSRKMILQFNDYNAAKNLFELLHHPIMRFGLWLQQYSQDMQVYCYKYFPDIDYSEIDTDEKLLNVLGCKDSTERKEILDYVNTFNFNEKRNDRLLKSETDPDSSPSSSEPSKSPSEMTLEELKDNFKEDYEQWNDGEYEEDFETWLRKKYPGKFIEKNEEGED